MTPNSSLDTITYILMLLWMSRSFLWVLASVVKARQG
jgi:hypothetical protein